MPPPGSMMPYPESVFASTAIEIDYTFSTKQDISTLRTKISEAAKKSNGGFRFVAGKGSEDIGRIVASRSGTAYTFVLSDNGTLVTGAVEKAAAPGFSKASMIKSHVAE